MSCHARAATRIALALLLAGCASEEERLAQHLERSAAYDAEGKSREALLELRSALQLSPADADVNHRIARILDREEQIGDAVFYYEEALRLDPTRHDAALSLAKLLLFDDAERARELIDGVIAQEPTHAMAYVRRSELALAEVDSAAALRAALTAVELAPDDGVALLQLGMVHRARIRELQLLGQPVDTALFEEAIAAFERGIEVLEAGEKPQLLVRAWVERAWVYSTWPERESQADQAFRQAAEVARQYPESEASALFLIARHARMHQEKEIERWTLERLVQLLPETLAWWERLADLADQRGEDGTAVLAKMVEAIPGHARASARFARHLAEANRPGEAIAHLEQAATRVDDPAVALGALADLHIRVRQLDAAREVVARLERDHADHEETDIAHARMRLAEGKRGEAVEILRELTSRVENPFALGLLAEVEYQLGNLERATTAVDQAIELIPVANLLRARMVRLRARIQIAAGDFEGAVQSFQRSRSRRGGQLHYRDRPFYALALYRTGNPDEGRRQLEAVLRDDNDWPPQVALVFARFEAARNPERTREVLEQAAQRFPRHPRILEILVRMDLAADRTEAALARVETALATAPEAVALQLLRARVLAASGDIDAALEITQKIVDAHPGAPQATALLVGLLQHQGRDGEAVATLDAAYRRGALNPGQSTVLARLLLARGEEDRAVEIFESVLAQRDDLAGVKNDLAFLIAKRGGDLQRALELARSARAAEPGIPEFADTLGFVYLLSELPEAALAQLQSAVSLAEESSRTYATSHYHLGLALKSLGRPEEAAAAFETALASVPDFPEADATRRELEAIANHGSS